MNRWSLLSVRFRCFFHCFARAAILAGLMLAGGALHAQTPVLMVLGDSLSAAYGIPTERGWVSLLAQRLERAGYRHRVVNASVSGDTSGGALARLEATLERHRPSVVVVELGGNDGLRGLPVAELRQNLAAIVSSLQSRGAEVLLVPMRLPPNYGAAYLERFEAVYEEVAAGTGVSLSPFILEDVAEHPELMQADGIHPAEAAQTRMLDNLWPALQALLDGPGGI